MQLKIVAIMDDGWVRQSPIGMSAKAAHKLAPEAFRRLYDEMTAVIEKESKQLKLDDYVTFL